MNETPSSPKAGSGVKKRITKTREKRRHAMQELILLEGLTKPQEITVRLVEMGFKAARLSVAEDIKYMMFDDEFWLQALTKSIWVAECRNQYLRTKKTMERLTTLSELTTTKETEFLERNAKFTWDKNPYNPQSDSSNYLKFENIRAKAYGAYMTRHNGLMGIAQIENAITKKQEWLQQFIKDLPLYWKLKQLSNWVDTNKPKDENIIAPVPEMEVLSTANQ